MSTVNDHCRLVRAKNAGPFRLTVDCFCKDDDAYATLVDVLDVQRVATALNADPDTVSRFTLADLNVVKFGLQRPVVQGSVGDRDLHGAQWAHVVANLTVDAPAALKSIASLTLVVKEYDEAIEWYTSKLDFVLKEDTSMGSKRWVVLSTSDAGPDLVLARASDARQSARVGDQTGGRVAFFLHTRDFNGDVQRFSERGVRFLESPRQESYGQVVVFEDLYGNQWDLLQPS